MSKKKGPPYGDTHSERRRQSREEKRQAQKAGKLPLSNEEINRFINESTLGGMFKAHYEEGVIEYIMRGKTKSLIFPNRGSITLSDDHPDPLVSSDVRDE